MIRRGLSAVIILAAVLLWPLPPLPMMSGTGYGEEPLPQGGGLVDTTWEGNKYETRRNPGLKYDEHGQIDPTPEVTPPKYLPRDTYGFVDWAAALRDKVIAPKDAIGTDQEAQTVLFQEDVLLKAKLPFMPDVIFPHAAHNRWLNCGVCHPKMFAMKAGASNVTMIGVWKGEFCGRCHDRVAFPIRNCFRCHSAPRKGAGIAP